LSVVLSGDGVDGIVLLLLLESAPPLALLAGWLVLEGDVFALDVTIFSGLDVPLSTCFFLLSEPALLPKGRDRFCFVGASESREEEEGEGTLFGLLDSLGGIDGVDGVEVACLFFGEDQFSVEGSVKLSPSSPLLIVLLVDM